jgi:exopolysaccharide biosynthesis polyprenyl glycosylphosphotransferase
MLRQQARFFNRFTIFCDLVAVALSFFLAHWIRSPQEILLPVPYYLWIFLVILPSWYFLLSHYRFYESIRTRPITQVLMSLVSIHLIGGVVVTSAIYLVDPQGFSRGLVGLFLLFSLAILGIEKIAQKCVLGYIRRRGYNFRQILVVGTDDKARRFIDLLDEHADWGLRIAGILRLADTEEVEEVRGHKVLGTLDQLIDTCMTTTVDEVVFCVPPKQLHNGENYTGILENMGITVRMVLDVVERSRARRELSLFHGTMPILTIYPMAFDTGQMFLKRCIDVAGSLAGLLMTGIAFPFIAAAIKMDSRGPVLFGQARVGENGRIFRCWKFRSMYADAETRKRELLPRNELNGAVFKIRHDPRITRVGRFLRRSSLDELPQFWNILRGEMSLVGTRPPTPDEVERYENWHRKRICIKPGLTGLWQVSGRNRITDFDEIARLDIKYIENWSLWLDLKILFKTLQVLMIGQGSY